MTVRWAFLAAALGTVGCGATVDVLGHDPPAASEPVMVDSATLRPLSGPSQYPNLFQDLLGKAQVDIDAKLEAAFQRLFHGDPKTEAIYFTVGDDQAYVEDILHGDVRTEGMALGMMIALQLDHREEFDKLWTYTASNLRYASGANAGYFRSSCGFGACADPYGHEELVMALLFAHGRWGSGTGTIDYGAEALRALGVMWDKEQQNGGVVDDVTNLVDATNLLVVDAPTRDHANAVRPVNVKPGYYSLWAQATGDDRWQTAVGAGRRFLRAAAHTKTGLFPNRAGFDGVAQAGELFTPEGYRVQLNMALDYMFNGNEPWYTVESDRVLEFFAGEGLTTYGASYPLDGSRCMDCQHMLALVAMNGVSAIAATTTDRKAFVEAIWAAEPRSGDPRYYDDLLQMLALLTLGGRMRVY